MKKGEKPQFSAQWWKTSKGSTVKDAGLEKALEAYEKAQTWLKFTKNTSTFDGARKALLALEPVVKKQIAACTAVVHAETIDVLKRFPPEIVKERARLEADAAEFDKNVAWVEQNFEMLTKAIAAIDKKLRAALADVDKRVVDFPAACKKGKGKQAKKDLASQNDVLEDLRQRFVEKDDNVEEMKKEQKELGVEGLTRVDWREPRAQCSNAMRDCDARLNAIRKTLAEFSDSDLEMLSTSYLKKLKQLTQAAVRLEGDVNSALGAARAEVKNLSKIPDEKTAAKRLADI
ncbi:MAG: hypothetical protein JNM56_07620, partial [Planctomycetia bacterium]|nr:hypothetical protein [Planctomycetia bacterium]